MLRCFKKSIGTKLSYLCKRIAQEDGAVTADMVVLIAGVVAMGMAVFAVFDPSDPSSPLGWWIFVLDELLRKAIAGAPLY